MPEEPVAVETPGQPTLSKSERGVVEQLFVVSAAMVGVCLTLMGLVGVIDSLGPLATIADDLLAADALVFLIACLSAYMSLRTRTARGARRYERVADISFIVAMVAMVGIGAEIALRII